MAERPSDLDRVLDYKGFADISNAPELPRPWAVGIRIPEPQTSPITWFWGEDMGSALMQAAFQIEQLDG
jgi:hypothetical protein